MLSGHNVKSYRKYSAMKLNLVLIVVCAFFYSGQALEEWELGPFVKEDSVNPIMGPKNDTFFPCPVRGETVAWEAKDVFNPTALVRGNQILMLYRAEDFEGQYRGTSRIGLAGSEDGLHFERLPLPIFYPDNDAQIEAEWEGGCEDPRIVQDDQGVYYLTYTAYNGSLARLFVASSKDLLIWTKHGSVFADAYDGKYAYTWSKSGSIVSSIIDDQMVATKVNDLYYMYWGESSIFYATSPDLIHWTPAEDSEGKLFVVFGTRAGKFDSSLVEPGPPAILRDDGILFIYNSRNNGRDGGDPDLPKGTYAAGQVLLDRKDPKTVLHRLDNYFFWPEKDYEIGGQVNNVVFLEGLVRFKGQYFLYYGTADSKIAVATLSDVAR